jgi:hypothetical protein
MRQKELYGPSCPGAYQRQSLLQFVWDMRILPNPVLEHPQLPDEDLSLLYHFGHHSHKLCMEVENLELVHRPMKTFYPPYVFFF